MATLHLNNLEFYAHHGCYKEEQEIGANYIVNLSYSYDSTKAELTDDINDAISYPIIYNIIKEQMSIPSHLIENVAKRILTSIRQNFPAIEHCSVKISKLAPPINGSIKSATIELEY